MIFQGRTWDYGKLLLWIIFFFLVLRMVFSYINTEIRTNLYLSQITNINELCQVDKNPDFKYARILRLERAFNDASIYCIYEDYTKNVRLDLNYRREKWEVYLTTRLNKDSNLYWPIYF